MATCAPRGEVSYILEAGKKEGWYFKKSRGEARNPSHQKGMEEKNEEK